jgi:pantothenate kinase-related protein Tda10
MLEPGNEKFFVDRFNFIFSTKLIILYSIFISGKGGCGKSFLLRKMIERLRQKNIEYFVTASTGLLQ